MKNGSSFLTVGILVLFSKGIVAQTIPALSTLPNGTSSNGDLVLGFSNPNSGAELLVNLGPAYFYYSTANGYASENSTQGGGALTPGVTYTVAAYNPSDLTAVLGTNGPGAAYSGNTVWGVVGGNGGVNGPGAESSRSLWLTGTAAQYSQTKAGQQILSDDLKTLTADMFDQQGNLSLASADSIEQSTSTDPSFTELMGTGDFNSGTGVNIVAAVTATGSSTLELYELLPTNATANPSGIATVDLGTFELSPGGLTFTPFGTSPPIGGSTARLINISARAQVGTGSNILIPGFVVEGSGMETLLIRADGPSLEQFGVSGVLALPTLAVYNSEGAVIASNAGWGTSPNPAQIASVASQLGAFSFASGSADCAVIVTLPAGAYTVEVAGLNNTTGIALSEIYEVSSTGTRLANLSTRAQVGTGGGIIISGFVVSGSGTEQLLVRGDGPSLTQFGVASALAQPSLNIIAQSSGRTIATNTVWGTNANPAEISSVAATVGAFGLTAGSADSAVMVSLPAGAYTAEVLGENNTTGVGLAELYEVP